MATHKGSLGTSGASHTTVLRLSFARKGKLTSVGWPERTSPSQTSPNWGGGMKHRFEGRTRQRATRLPSARVRACPHAMVSTVSPAEVVMCLAAGAGVGSGCWVAGDGADDSVACASTTAAAGTCSESAGSSTGILLVRATSPGGARVVVRVQGRINSFPSETAAHVPLFQAVWAVSRLEHLPSIPLPVLAPAAAVDVERSSTPHFDCSSEVWSSAETSSRSHEHPCSSSEASRTG